MSSEGGDKVSLDPPPVSQLPGRGPECGRMPGDRWDLQMRGSRSFPNSLPEMSVIHLNQRGKVLVRNRDAWVAGVPICSKGRGMGSPEQPLGFICPRSARVDGTWESWLPVSGPLCWVSMYCFSVRVCSFACSVKMHLALDKVFPARQLHNNLCQ